MKKKYLPPEVQILGIEPEIDFMQTCSTPSNQNKSILEQLGVEKRTRIQYFYADTKKEEGTVVSFYLENETTFILGREYVLEPNTKLIYYILPLKVNKAFIFLCIDNDNRYVNDLLNDIGDSNFTYFKATWPLFAKFIENNQTGNYSNPFLLPMEFSTQKFFCVGKVMENVRIEDYDNEYAISCLGELYKQVTEALLELTTKKMSLRTRVKQAFNLGKKYFKIYNTTDVIIRVLTGF